MKIYNRAADAIGQGTLTISVNLKIYEENGCIRYDIEALKDKSDEELHCRCIINLRSDQRTQHTQ